MATLIFLQILMIAVQTCRSEEEPQTTVIIQDTRTEMTVEEIGDLSREDKGYFDYFERPNEADSDLDLDYDDDGDPGQDEHISGPSKEHLMKEAMLKAMKKPAIRQQIGEVIPILRVMSPAQRLTLAALVSSQIMSQGRLSEADLTEMASMFAGSHPENSNERQNITEHLLLPISVDIAKIFRGLGKDIGRSLRFDIPGRGEMKRIFGRPSYLRRRQADRRIDDFADDSDVDHHRTMTKSDPKPTEPSASDCEYFSTSFCLEVADYPVDAIIKSVEKHRGLMDTLLEDFRIPIPDLAETRPPHRKRLVRRQDVGINEIREGPLDKEYMCSAAVKYARPKRARTTSGEWKYIVNAGDYTQTLRLEMCLKPTAPCSHLTNNIQSQCKQVYNYHRLLTWEEKKGLHMDMFKVPSCCSCQIQGYTPYYAPTKDISLVDKRRESILVRPPFGSQTNTVPNFVNPAGKREVVRIIPLSDTTASPKLNTFAPKVTRGVVERLTPLHHLIPSGPPLPLEGEIIKIRGDLSLTNRKLLEDLRRVGQVPVPKLDLGGSKDDRVYSKYSTPQPANRYTQNKHFPDSNLILTPHAVKYSNPQSAVAGSAKPVSEIPLRQYEVYESTSSRGAPAAWTTPRTKPRTTPRTTRWTTTTTTTTTTTQSPIVPQLPKTVYKQEKIGSNGKKRINYSYHPIIEFFNIDYGNSTKDHPSQHYSKPLSSALSVQGWKPMVGRG